MPKPVEQKFDIGDLVEIEKELAMFSDGSQSRLGIIYAIRKTVNHWTSDEYIYCYEYKVYWQTMNDDLDEWMPEMFLNELN